VYLRAWQQQQQQQQARVGRRRARRVTHESGQGARRRGLRRPRQQVRRCDDSPLAALKGVRVCRIVGPVLLCVLRHGGAHCRVLGCTAKQVVRERRKLLRQAAAGAVGVVAQQRRAVR
jgi:hypothetical protein